MKSWIYLFCVIAIFAQSGCKEKKPEYSAGNNGTNTVEQKPEAETLSSDDIVLPEGKTIDVEFFVENSEPVLPGTSVDIIDSGSSPSHVIVSGVRVKSARWKVDNPFTKPKYPASGFIALTLAENQWKVIEGKDIAVRQNKK